MLEANHYRFYPDGSYERAFRGIEPTSEEYRFGGWTYDAKTGSITVTQLFRITKRGVGKATVHKEEPGPFTTYESYADEIEWGGSTVSGSWKDIAERYEVPGP